MERPHELQSLMRRLAEGDRAAFHPVFETLWPILRRFAARHLPPQEAEDVAQEALLKIFHRAAGFDPERSALAWALGITAYEVRTARKKTMRRRETSQEPWARPDPGLDPEEAAIVGDLEALLRDSLGTLRPEDATTLGLYARGDRAAIAAATFRKRVERALRKLRTVMKSERTESR